MLLLTLIALLLLLKLTLELRNLLLQKHGILTATRITALSAHHTLQLLLLLLLLLLSHPHLVIRSTHTLLVLVAPASTKQRLHVGVIRLISTPSGATAHIHPSKGSQLCATSA